MKKIIILIAIAFAAYTCHSQTYDNALTSQMNMKICKITGVKASFVDTANATRMGLRIVNDDMYSYVTVNVVMADSLGNSYLNTNYTITGANYTSWNRSVNQLFNYVANKLGVTLK